MELHQPRTWLPFATQTSGQPFACKLRPSSSFPFDAPALHRLQKISHFHMFPKMPQNQAKDIWGLGVVCKEHVGRGQKQQTTNC